jgi:hypothetical protein
MGNNCHGSRQRSKMDTKLSAHLSHTFSLDVIQYELNKKNQDATKINLQVILDELYKLNSCSIAARSYTLTNFNVALANVLCATCFRLKYY